MFVYVVVAQRAGGDRYIVAVFAEQRAAREHAQRWLRWHPTGDVDVQRFAVIDGTP